MRHSRKAMPRFYGKINRTVSPILTYIFPYNQGKDMWRVIKLSEARNAIGFRLRQARLAEKPKATQEDISARLAVIGVTLSASSIGKIETGARPVTDLQLIALAKVLKRSVAWLVGE